MHNLVHERCYEKDKPGAGQSIAATAAILDLPDQTLHNWLKAHREGQRGKSQ
jgi:transposase-like protein